MSKRKDTYLHLFPRDVLGFIWVLVEPSYQEEMGKILDVFSPGLTQNVSLQSVNRDFWRSRLEQMTETPRPTNYFCWSVVLGMVDLLVNQTQTLTDRPGLPVALFALALQDRRVECLKFLLDYTDRDAPLLLLITGNHPEYIPLLANHLPSVSHQFQYLKTSLKPEYRSCFRPLLDLIHPNLSILMVGRLIREVCQTEEVSLVKDLQDVIGTIGSWNHVFDRVARENLCSTSMVDYLLVQGLVNTTSQMKILSQQPDQVDRFRRLDQQVDYDRSLVWSDCLPENRDYLVTTYPDTDVTHFLISCIEQDNLELFRTWEKNPYDVTRLLIETIDQKNEAFFDLVYARQKDNLTESTPDVLCYLWEGPGEMFIKREHLFTYDRTRYLDHDEEEVNQFLREKYHL